LSIAPFGSRVGDGLRDIWAAEKLLSAINIAEAAIKILYIFRGNVIES
jgi:hypothetical protein